jgi:beta-glucosidase
VLPIAASVRSIAVIGTPSSASPLASGGGSSHVAVTSTVTPLEAIKAAWPRATVLPAAGEPAASPAVEISGAAVSPALPTVPPPAGHPIYHVDSPPTGTWMSWSGTLRPPSSGWFRISVVSHGDTELSIDGRQLLDDPGTHGPVIDQLGYDFTAGERYPMTLRWFEYDHDVPKISWQNVTPMLDAAASAAAKADIAVVFAGNESTEGADNPSLALNGVQNELIESVARANPRTVVVLDSGGAVLMPWLSSVRAVLEDWYPGQDDGVAIASLLSGATDPSGRLPVSFPISAGSTSVTSTAQWPGTNGVVNLDDSGDAGLDIGYRYYEAHHVPVLFPFGSGDSYTTFSLQSPRLTSGASGGSSTGAAASITVTNTGTRSGTEVVEAYLRDPAAADEPPEQLAAFAPVTLAPGASSRVILSIPAAAFSIWRTNGFEVVPGTYGLNVGTSSADLPFTLDVTRS